jgi:pterin-4a-carbinolamine dehydratase
VTLTYSTHSAGGLTEKDFAGAATANGLAAKVGG